MTDGTNASLPDAPESGWRRLPPVAALVRTLLGAATGAALAVVSSSVAMTVVAQSPAAPMVDGIAARALVLLIAVSLGAVLGAVVGRARWRRTRWRLDAQGLRIRRGLAWRMEVLVPRSRVQHLDIERGPIERRVGLATLVVHTAGSQTPALRQAGLADADAVALRDALIPAARDGDAL